MIAPLVLSYTCVSQPKTAIIAAATNSSAERLVHKSFEVPSPNDLGSYVTYGHASKKMPKGEMMSSV